MSAGTRKEREQGAKQTKAGIAEFDLKRGMFTSILSGVMSSCMAFGIAAGEPIRALAIEMGSAPLWQGLPVLCAALALATMVIGIGNMAELQATPANER